MEQGGGGSKGRHGGPAAERKRGKGSYPTASPSPAPAIPFHSKGTALELRRG